MQPSEPIMRAPKINSLTVLLFEIFTMNAPTAGASAIYHAQ
jgi:hypothetical protein